MYVYELVRPHRDAATGPSTLMKTQVSIQPVQADGPMYVYELVRPHRDAVMGPSTLTNTHRWASTSSSRWSSCSRRTSRSSRNARSPRTRTTRSSTSPRYEPRARAASGWRHHRDVLVAQSGRERATPLSPERSDHRHERSDHRHDSSPLFHVAKARARARGARGVGVMSSCVGEIERVSTVRTTTEGASARRQGGGGGEGDALLRESERARGDVCPDNGASECGRVY